jgi:hypothetical protein
MEHRIAKLKNDFNNIVSIRTSVKTIFDTLEQRIDKLKSLYADFIKHNENILFVFGLDSFRFQSKLIDIEYEDMKRLFLAINNRMYCEYFKLYKIILAYITENITDKKILEILKINNFPVYKDLEPFKEYKIETVLELHENILLLLTSIVNNMENKENELLVYQNKRKIGLNIDNFVTSFNFDIIMIREKVSLFLTYVEFFHKLHAKYLKRFSNKIQLMYAHINNDIKFDEHVDMSSDNKADVIHDNNSQSSDSSDNENTKMNTPCNSVCSDSSNYDLNRDTNMRKNSFLGFCSQNNIDYEADFSRSDDINDVFGAIDSTCESILHVTDNANVEITHLRIEDAQSGALSSLNTRPLTGVLNEERCKTASSYEQLTLVGSMTSNIPVEIDNMTLLRDVAQQLELAQKVEDAKPIGEETLTEETQVNLNKEIICD